MSCVHFYAYSQAPVLLAIIIFSRISAFLWIASGVRRQARALLDLIFVRVAARTKSALLHSISITVSHDVPLTLPSPDDLLRSKNLHRAMMHAATLIASTARLSCLYKKYARLAARLCRLSARNNRFCRNENVGFLAMRSDAILAISVLHEIHRAASNWRVRAKLFTFRRNPLRNGNRIRLFPAKLLICSRHASLLTHFFPATVSFKEM